MKTTTIHILKSRSVGGINIRYTDGALYVRNVMSFGAGEWFKWSYGERYLQARIDDSKCTKDAKSSAWLRLLDIPRSAYEV